MERKKKHGIIRRGIAIILSIVLTMVGIDFGQVVSVKAETDYTTLYFIDDTKEQWISNNHAVMKAIDNSNRHNSYWMTQVDDATWSVKVPKSAYNITFNRYKSDKTTQWNSWSAGGRDGNNAYYAEGSEYGHWGVKKEAGFQEGDIIYLDVSEFTEWENNKAIMYVNFTDASKEDNGGKNIVMSSADNTIYNPQKAGTKVEEYVYRYIVTKEDEGASKLRFWRGNNTTLWNCSSVLSYAEYAAGSNCVKITDWSSSKCISYDTKDISIKIDTDDFEYYKSEQFYVISKAIDKITGYVEANEKISCISYSVTGCDGNETYVGTVKCNNNQWEIKDKILVIGKNTLTVIAKGSNGKEYSQKVILQNISPDNLGDYQIPEKDTDGDGIIDYYEYNAGTDINKVDTDEDGLSDYEELVYLLTNPLEKDTDNNGITDANEDVDGDGLTNKYELQNELSVWNSDTDSDSLSDGDEVFTYFTKPDKEDTDEDGLLDGEEIELGLNPNKKDSDDDSIMDGDEKFEQTYTEKVQDDSVIDSLSVKINCSGVLENKISIEDVSKIDTQSAEVVGIIGNPYEITCDTKFEEATISFAYDDTKLGTTDENNLRVMWYDEKNDDYVILEDSKVDTKNNVVSYETTHFSTYLLVDQKIWLDNWRESISYRNSSEVEYYDLALLVDVSGSMTGSRISLAKTTLNAFIDALYGKDEAAIVKFNSYAYTIQEMTSDKELLKSKVNTLYASGGTDAIAALSQGINEITKAKANHVSNHDQEIYKNAVVLICDGDVSYDSSIVEKAKENDISINCINVASSSNYAMVNYCNETGGNYYYAATTQDLANAMLSLERDFNEIDTTDADHDGLYDVYELMGMRLPNGQIVTTDPTKVDTDGDGISDANEFGTPWMKKFSYGTMNYSCTVFHNGQRLKGFTILTEDEYKNYIPYGQKKFNEVYVDQVFEDGVPAVDRFGDAIYGTDNLHGTLDGTVGIAKEIQLNCLARAGIFLSGVPIAPGMDPLASDAASFLRKYIANEGGVNTYNAINILKNANAGMCYAENMKKLISACESYMKENQTIYIANSRYNAMTGYPQLDTGGIKGILNVASNLPEFVALGLCDAGVVAKVSKNGNEYTIEYTYYLIDYYDFDKSILPNYYMMNRYGKWQSYMNYGLFSSSFTWEKGEGANEIKIFM